MRASFHGRTIRDLVLPLGLVLVLSPATQATDCNGNGVPDDQEPQEDCNGNGVPDECEIAIVSSVPPSGAIDARLPHDPSDPAIPRGWDTIAIDFADSSGGTATPCALTVEDFSVSVTGGVAPVVVDAFATGNRVTLTLDRPIPAGEWTTVTHDLSGTSLCLGFLPGDVNNDGWSAPTDHLALDDHLAQPALETWQADIDRDGDVDADDLAALATLLEEGALYTTLAPDPCDPTSFDCLQCDPPQVNGVGSRYLEITPDPGPYPVALVVSCSGAPEKYVGPPGGPHNIARLVEDPADAAWLTPAGWGGSVHVTGLSITGYSVYAVKTDFGIGGDITFSPGGAGTTWMPYDVDNSGGVTDFLDILGAVQVFQNEPSGQATVYSADVVGAIDLCEPDGRVSMLDIHALVSAFQGNPSCSGACDLPGGGITTTTTTARLELRPVGSTTIQPGDVLTVEVWLHDFEGYVDGCETTLEVDPGESPGNLNVVDVRCDPHDPDFLFVGCEVVIATDPLAQTSVSVLTDPCGAVTPTPRKLAEFDLQASPEASGDYVVRGGSDPSADTLLLPMVMITVARPIQDEITITVVPAGGRGGPLGGPRGN